VDSTSDFLTTGKVIVILFCDSPLEVEIESQNNITITLPVVKKSEVESTTIDTGVGSKNFELHSLMSQGNW
jgi:hypothetical protein